MAFTKEWRLKDTVLIGLVAVAFAVVYLAAVYIGVFISTLATPLGLAPLANEPICGIWFMAATFIAFVLRKPGAAVITNILAALIEVFLGSFYGPLVFVDGLVAGLGAELVFALYGYKNFNLAVMCMAGLASAVTSFTWELYRSGFIELSWKFLIIMFPVRCVSGMFFAGFICSKLGNSLRSAGLLRSFMGNV
ncbi:MAG: ECF transporter S component [Deltaproteobacteria bacterium]|jgi:energy-coupling factor transport system substrate-specific component|nr:ECF transporter S component [Deltaproteobacteria bacterium]